MTRMMRWLGLDRMFAVDWPALDIYMAEMVAEFNDSVA